MKGIILLVFVFSLFVCCLSTPLDDYVNTPDPSYKYVVNSTIKGLTFTAYNLRLTSQTWMTRNESNYPTWEHWLVVCIPDVILTKTSFIYIDGGHINDPPPTSVYVPVELLCLTGSVGAHLQTIPNEPIEFENDGIRRTEDGIIAYTWSHFMNNTDEPIWLARMPMVKATVRAMDAIQDFTQKFTPNKPIDSFILGGASKRGWTTWLAGAVDTRVIGIVPMVMPILNIVPNMGHQYQCYGEWSFALQDYLDFGIMAYLNTEKFLAMAAIIDPLNYLERLSMPKYVIASSGDEFFLPDSPQFFWDSLPGQKNLRVIPNAEHSLAGHDLDLTQGIATFFHLVVNRMPIPEISYNITYTPTGAVLVASSNMRPSKVMLFHALTLSHTKRDFRLVVCDKVNSTCIQPILWIPETLHDQGNFTYTATVSAPSQGWRGFLIQFDYNFGAEGLYTFKQSTQAYVVPNTLPFPPCGNNCQPGISVKY
jgi:PhoPQ-activated pathogenicity-related protein